MTTRETELEKELESAIQQVYRIRQEAMAYIWLARATIASIFVVGIAYLLTYTT